MQPHTRRLLLMGALALGAPPLTAQVVELSTLTTAGGGGFVVNGQAANDYSGRAVASAGDVNGDGLTDVIVGAPNSDPASLSNAGRSYIVFGKTGTDPVALSALGTAGIVINGQGAGNVSGSAVSAAGDVNGDGLADVIVGARLSDPDAMRVDAGRSYIIFSPYGIAPQTPAIAGSYTTFVAPGNPDPQGIGTNRFGDDRTVFADSRLSIDLDAGTGTRSLVTAVLARTDATISGFNEANLADVFWQVSTTRTGWANAVVTVNYTNAEIAGLTEGSLKLYRSTTKSGHWTELTTTIDAARNEASGTLTSLPTFLVLAQPDTTGPTFTISLLNASPTAAENLDFIVSFSESVGTTFTAADVSLTGTLAGTSSVGTVTAQPGNMVFTVPVTAAPAATDGTLGISLTLAGITDAAGNPATGTPTSPLYTIVNVNYAAGDVDKNGVVNVADVTLLSNFIVNGAPPLP